MRGSCATVVARPRRRLLDPSNLVERSVIFDVDGAIAYFFCGVFGDRAYRGAAMMAHSSVLMAPFCAFDLPHGGLQRRLGEPGLDDTV